MLELGNTLQTALYSFIHKKIVLNVLKFRIHQLAPGKGQICLVIIIIIIYYFLITFYFNKIY